MKVVDYEIFVQDLIPPIGGIFKYFAIIRFLCVETPDGSKLIKPGLGETHGKTREDAEAKMQKKLDDWLQHNSNQKEKT